MKNRLLGLEVLRIFSMLLILLWHINGHILPEIHNQSELCNKCFKVLSYFISFHVDLFVLISGFCGISDFRKALIKNGLLIIWYIWVIAIIGILLGEVVCIEKLFLPITNCPWWFMRMYVFLVLISPFLNTIATSCSNFNDWLKLLGIVGVLDMYFGFWQQDETLFHNGFGLINFIFLYFLGRFYASSCFKQICEKIQSKLFRCDKYLFICGGVLLLLRYIFGVKMGMKSFSGNYSSPYTVIMASFVFLYFKNISIKSKWILHFSTSAVAVYLITDHPMIRNLICIILNEMHDNIIVSEIGFLLLLFAFVFGLFVVCVGVDKIRLLLISPLQNKLIKYFAN